MEDCIFCSIINKGEKRTLESENELAVAFKSNAPAADVHILIVPKEHISNFLEIDPKNTELLTSMVSLVQELIKLNKLEPGYKLIFNGGRHQAVPHVHWHLLGGNLHEEAESKT